MCCYNALLFGSEEGKTSSKSSVCIEIYENRNTANVKKSNRKLRKIYSTHLLRRVNAHIARNSPFFIHKFHLQIRMDESDY